LVNNVQGIRTEGPPFATGNLIIGNSASNNGTNFDIAAGNFIGTVVSTENEMNSSMNGLVNIEF
jgi:hypothetical protein